MAVQYLSNSSISAGASTSRSFSFEVVSEANLCLIAGSYNTYPKATSVTYNGVSMTAIAAANYGSEESKLFYLINPEVGTHTLSCAWGGNSNNNHLACILFSGVDQNNPIGDSDTNIGKVNSSSSVLSGKPGDMGVDILGNETDFPSVGAGQTSIGSASASIWIMSMSYEPVTGSSVTMSWTTPSASDDHQHVAALLNAAPLVGGSPIYFYFKPERSKWQRIFASPGIAQEEF